MLKGAKYVRRASAALLLALAAFTGAVGADNFPAQSVQADSTWNFVTPPPGAATTLAAEQPRIVTPPAEENRPPAPVGSPAPLDSTWN